MLQNLKQFLLNLNDVGTLFCFIGFVNTAGRRGAKLSNPTTSAVVPAKTAAASAEQSVHIFPH